MVTHNWVYVKSGMVSDTTVGPVSEQDFLAKIKAGELTPDTLVKSDTRTKGQWCHVKQIKGCMQIWNEGAKEREDARQRKAEEKRREKELRRQRSLQESQVNAMLADQHRRELAAISDSQDASLVASIQEKVGGILTRGEQIEYVAVQKRPVLNIKPDAVVITSRRLIFFRPKLLGRFDFDDYLWRELSDAHLTQGIMGSTFTARHLSGRVVTMEYLSKEAAKRLYRISQEREESAIEERRKRRMEESRAGAAQIAIQHNVGDTSAPHSPANNDNDLAKRLSTLKTMLEGGLITQEDFDAKKRKILEEL